MIGHLWRLHRHDYGVPCLHTICSCLADDIKVFYAGARWALRLPRSAVKSRQQLAKALNDAFAGDITSVGQGESLTVVFVNTDGSLVEMGPTRWADRRRSSEQSAGWQMAAKTAVRIYAR